MPNGKVTPRNQQSSWDYNSGGNCSAVICIYRVSLSVCEAGRIAVPMIAIAYTSRPKVCPVIAGHNCRNHNAAVVNVCIYRRTRIISLISSSGFQNRRGLTLARIVVRDVVEIRSTIFIFRACQSIERT